ncbi:MAG: phage holin family protein [Solirubrobacteraceae bacterium]
MKYPLAKIFPISLIGSFVFPETNIQLAIFFLIILMTLDFITGITASYILEKNKFEAIKLISKNKTINDFLYFFNTDSIYKLRCVLLKLNNVISSLKLKNTGIKISLYFGSVIIVYLFEQIFFIKKFKLSFSEMNFTATSFIVLFWCGVEFYSIFFENFKKIGLDIKSILLKYFKEFISIKKEINNL